MEALSKRKRAQLTRARLVKTQLETATLLAMSAEPLLSEEEIAPARQRRLEAMTLQEMKVIR
jgi:hypothetical protein